MPGFCSCQSPSRVTVGKLIYPLTVTDAYPLDVSLFSIYSFYPLTMAPSHLCIPYMPYFCGLACPVHHMA